MSYFSVPWCQLLTNVWEFFISSVWVRNTHTLQSIFSGGMHVIFSIFNWKCWTELYKLHSQDCCVLFTLVRTVKAVTVTILTLEPRTHHLLCKLIWWLGGWHNLSRPETLLGLTDRASWGRGRRACPTVLWKTQREAARLHRQTVQNNNAGVVRSNQTELNK